MIHQCKCTGAVRSPLLRRLLALGLALLLPALASAGDKVIRMYAGADCADYTPTLSMVKSELNPYPRHNIRILADRWQAAHPGYKIEFVQAPSGVGNDRNNLNYRAWVVSNFVGGTIPEIIYQNMGSYRESDFRKGWIVDMDPYLAKPNPYVQGNRQWLDIFYKPWIDAMRSEDGHCYWIGPDTIGVGLLYNKDILKKVGIEKPPATLGQLLTDCKKIQDAGYIAYFTKYEWYVDCVVPSVIWADRIPSMDLNHDRIIDVREMTYAIKKGLFNAGDERFKEYLRIFKEIGNYYPKGYKVMEPLYMFNKGKVAFMEGHSLFMKKVADDPLREFEFAVAPFPEITKEDSRFGGAPLAGCGNAGYTTTYQLTKVAKEHGTLDACVDWLMFLTSPQNAEMLVNENGFTLPGVRGAKPIPLFQPLMNKALQDIQRPNYLDWHAFNPINYSVEFADSWLRIKEGIALDVMTIDDASTRCDFWLARSYKSAIRRNTKWETEKW